MTRIRFAFIHDKDNLLLIVRPIGDMPGDVVADNIINAYRSVEAPWTYSRVIDLRRHTGYISNGDRGRIAAAWAEITAGIDYHAHVAMLMHDPYEQSRLPKISADFPHETICIFTDYHEAVGWHLATDRGQYLKTLGDCPISIGRDDAISIH